MRTELELLYTITREQLEWEQSAVKNDAQKQTESLLEKERMAVQALQQQLEQQMKLVEHFVNMIFVDTMTVLFTN